MSNNVGNNPWYAPDTFGGRTATVGDYAPVQWPLKLMRVSPVAPYFHRANVVLAADCAAFSYARFRERFGANSTLVIGCPDAYGESFMDKFAQLLTLNDVVSVTLVRMDAPCCRRMTDAVMSAIRLSRKDIPLNLTTLFTEGEIVD
jgi:hypothetical protein